MTEYSRFFGGPEGAVPEYNQTHDAEVYRLMFSYGVFDNVENELAVTETDPVSLGVKVDTGWAFVHGFWYHNDNALTKTLGVADPEHSRIDRIVLRLDSTTSFKISCEVKQGTPAASPSPPSLTQTDAIYEISLAQVLIEANVTSVSNSKITDERSFAASKGVVKLIENQTIAGVKTFSDGIKTDTINEETSGAGVTIDGIPIKSTLSSGITDKTRHINLTPAGAIVPATNGAEQTQVDGTNKSYYVLNYDKSTDEHAYWHFVVPEQYDGGNCVFDIWCKSAATSGAVIFVISTGDVADAATFDAALGTTITFDAKAVDGTAGDAFVASKTADPGWTAGRLATVKLTRDADNANDTAGADVSVLIIEIKFEVV